jgi:SAM-dependent methyltransferase
MGIAFLGMGVPTKTKADALNLMWGNLLSLSGRDLVVLSVIAAALLVPMVLERITSAGILYELDFAEKMIEVNKSLHKEDNFRFIVADVAESPLEDASCDVILCFSSFPHFHDKERSLRKLARILKCDGRLTVAHFDSGEAINRRHESCHAVMHDHLPGQSEMRDLFQRAGLNVELFVDEPGFYCIIAKKAG